MNYIGSKYSLIDFIKDTVHDVLVRNKELRQPCEMVFADLFAGTGIVSGSFKELGYSIIANDIQYYSYVITKHMIENNGNLNKERCSNLIADLNSLTGTDGFVYKNYSYGGTDGQEFRRMYFSDYNARKCDAIRQVLDEWLKRRDINDSEFYYLLASLIDSIDRCANTALVYGAYLKKLKSKAERKMELIGLPIMPGKVNCSVYNEDACSLVKRIKGDILYLDPPYNDRQYCSNYHVLETIAKNDNPKLHGKTGLRDYFEQKSLFCSKSTAADALQKLIADAKFKYIFLSYNNEGIISKEFIEKTMKEYGQYFVYSKEYHRFKSDRDENRKHKAKTTLEYIHCLIKSDDVLKAED